MVDLGAPLGSIWGAPEPPKPAKSAVLSSKTKVFAVWRAGPENGRRKPQNEPQKAPRQARNLPREKTESGVRKNSWCNRVPRCVLRLSGGSTVKLSRFFVVWWSRGKSLAFSVVWWFCGKSRAFSEVWWLRGKFLKCSLVRRPQRKVQAVFA